MRYFAIFNDETVAPASKITQGEYLERYLIDVGEDEIYDVAFSRQCTRAHIYSLLIDDDDVWVYEYLTTKFYDRS